MMAHDLTFPFVEVLNHETGLPVSIVAWHVRSVRPIREEINDEDTITRIEFANGDVLDSSDSVTQVLEGLRDALRPVTGCLDSVTTFAVQRAE